MPTPLLELNAMEREGFVQLVGPVFEHSPWIAEATWSKRPFASREVLHAALCETVRGAGQARQLGLIQAHPDLVGKAALAGKLTTESSKEQGRAGLGNLSPEEIALFQNYNGEYRDKFGFPFVICARLNKKAAIITGFEERLGNSREQEIQNG